MVLNTPWTTILGAPRVSVELAESFRALGHTVESYSLDDAFPTTTRLSAMFVNLRFPRRARAYVRANADRFDVIQSDPGHLPYSKADLGFRGRLVVRSNGLPHLYRQAERRFDWQRGIERGTLGGRALRWIARMLTNEMTRVERALGYADVVVLINQDEFRFVHDALGHRDKAFRLPLGLKAETLGAFRREASPAAERRAAQLVTFIGSWTPRKGIADLPLIVRHVRREVPAARFCLLGTGRSVGDVLATFNPKDRGAIEVKPAFAAAELPTLLRRATVGVLPSYIEGFPYNVLEHLAAGVPIITYDVPGPREMLAQMQESLMVSAGDSAAMAERVVAILGYEQAHYARLSEAARQVAETFHWEPVAERSLALYAGARAS